MDAFTSFFDSQSSSTSHRWSYDSLKNFREISPIVQNHIKQVYFTLCVAVAASAVGVYLHVLWNIGGFLTTVASIGSMIWFLSTPPSEERKRVSLLLSSAMFQGASIGPLIDVPLAIDPSVIFSAFVATSLAFACSSVQLWLQGVGNTSTLVACSLLGCLFSCGCTLLPLSLGVQQHFLSLSCILGFWCSLATL
uniref:Bax inhibitor 1 n=1 Tax=Lotus japonicus TaxID=34305 RepID=I3SVB3_LOTJA|nr:unknown [Lotus japonicus]